MTFSKTSEFKVAGEGSLSEHKANAESVDEIELQNLRARWLRALQEHFARRFPNVHKIRQDGVDRFFYSLQTLESKTELQKTTVELRCLGEDLEVYDVKLVYITTDNPSGTRVEATFRRVDPKKAGLDGSKIGNLVSRIILGIM
jgi:hypothetical protein